MSAIIECISQTALNLYFTIHDSSGNVWNGSAFETYNASNWSTYVTTLSEQSPTGYYKATFPSTIAAGKYTFVQYQRQSGSPATTDPTIGVGSMYWNGTTEEQGIGIAVAATPVTLAASQPSINIGTVASVTTIGATGLTAIQTYVQALLNATAMPELTSVPSATPTIHQALMMLYMAIRNSHTADASSEKIKNNAGVTVATATLSDDGTTFTKGQFA